MILFQGFFQRAHDLSLVFFLDHVNEIQYHDTTKISEAELAGDCLRGLEIGLEDRLLQISVANESAGIDIDGCHRFGLINDQIAARFQMNLTLQSLMDLIFNAVQIEYRPLSRVMLDDIRHLGNVGLGKFFHDGIGLPRIHADLFKILVNHVTQHAQEERQILVHNGSGLHLRRSLVDRLPESVQINQIARDRLRRCHFGCSSDDITRFMVAFVLRQQHFSQSFTLLVAFYPGRDADIFGIRHVNQIARRYRDIRRQPRALGS